MNKSLALGCGLVWMLAGCLSSDDGPSCGASRTFATTPRPAFLATDGAFLYFTDAAVGGGSVRKVSLGGGDVTTLDPDVKSPYAIAVAGDTVYFTDDQNGLVMSVPTAGGTTTTIASGEGFPYAIAVDDSNVYWTNRTAGEVRAVARAGGAGAPITTLAAGINTPRGIAVAGGTLYLGSNAGMMRMPADGSTAPVALTSRTNSADAVAVDGTSVYWVDHPVTADGIYKAPLAGGDATLLASNNDQYSDLFSDGSNVYFTDITINVAFKVGVDGGSRSVVACGMKNPVGVIVVGGSAYVANLEGGAIVSAPK
jgi:hypothetical protein